MDSLKTIFAQVKPIKGQRLSDWLKRFLTAPKSDLAKWSGTFTEVTTAKVVEIYRKRGVIEEHEFDQTLFGQLVNAAYRAEALKYRAPEDELEENKD